MATVVLAGTFDTKGGEYAFARDKLLSQGLVKKVLMIDIGVRSTPDTEPRADINAAQVVAAAGGNYEELKKMTEAEAFVILTKGLIATLLDLHKKGSLHGVMGMGGGCGSALLSPAFQKLPLGVPKLLVSTVIACGPARPYIGGTDMTLMYAVTDFGGHVTSVNKQIVSNAAAAIGGMAADYAANESQHYAPEKISTALSPRKPLIAASMIGFTQAAVLAAEKRLNHHGYEVVLFHSVGAGGEAMENLIATGGVAGVLDITLMEVMHSLLPINMVDAGPNRLETAARLGVPQVIAPGAVDGLTFGPRSMVPPPYQDRIFNAHNANFGAVRSYPEENTRLGELIATKLNKSKGPVTLFFPHGGFSAVAVAGAPFFNKEIDDCLLKSLQTHIDPNVVRIVEREENINDPKLAEDMADTLHEYVKQKQNSK